MKVMIKVYFNGFVYSYIYFYCFFNGLHHRLDIFLHKFLLNNDLLGNMFVTYLIMVISNIHITYLLKFIQPSSSNTGTLKRIFLGAT